MFGGIRFITENMEKSAGAGYSTATDIAEYLVRKGVPFRKAHEITGKIVRYAIDNGKTLKELTMKEYASHCPSIGEDIYESIDEKKAVASRASAGGTAPARVREQIRAFRKRLGK
jgi:argininosuccinate lyase